MDENEVIEHLCNYLETQGWHITSRVAAGDRGIDVVAIHPNRGRFFIEAKGGTSSRPGSSRHGKPYTKTQVFDVTSKGLMQCLHHIAANKNQVHVAFAYPDDKYFSDYIDPIKPLLNILGLNLFCIKNNGSVELTANKTKLTD
jgi:hypothetical protein